MERTIIVFALGKVRPKRFKRIGQVLGFACLMGGIVPIGCSEGSEPSAVAGEAGASQRREHAVSPQAIDKSLAAAEDYFGRQELASAEAILIKLIEKAPRDHRVYELFGRVLFLKGVEARARGEQENAAMLLDQAYGRYRTSVELASELDPVLAAGLHQSAGEIAVAAGRSDDALGHFQQAGRLDPTNSKHPLYAAQIVLQQERWVEARHLLDRVLTLDPDEAFAYASLAAVALHEDNQAKAIEHIEEARRIDPQTLALRIQEAKVRRRCGQPRRGLELLVMLDEKQRAEEAVAYEIAECYLLLGKPMKSAKAWEHRYRRHPSAWLAAVRVAEALLEADRPEEARIWYEQARLAAPEAPQVRSLAESFEKREGESR